MKKIFLFTALTTAFSTTFASAATIKNTDAAAYTLDVTQQDGAAFRVVIEPHGTIVDLCADCTVEVVDFSLRDIGSEQNLSIRDGVIGKK